MLNSVGLTSNGNEYKKSNIGKIVCATPSVGIASLGVGGFFKDSWRDGVPKPQFLVGVGLATLLTLAGGLLVGSIIDNYLDKNRMIQADGEAKRKGNKLKTNV